MTRTTVLIAAVLLALGWAAFHLHSPSGKRAEPDRDKSLERPLPGLPPAVLSGDLQPEGSRDPAGDEPREAASESEPILSRDELWSSAPPGEPSEWTLPVYGARGSPRPPAWLIDLVRLVAEDLHMAIPPFDGSLVFGQADRDWLSEVRRSFESEYWARHDPSAAPSLEAEMVEELHRAYRALLTSVAAARVDRDSGSYRLFQDTRTLAQLEPGSKDARWLSAMIDRVDSPEFWSFPDLLDAEDRRLLCAADLVLLRRWNDDLWAARRRPTTDTGPPDPDELRRQRNVVGSLAELLSGRR